jgi:hypothetical protein
MVQDREQYVRIWEGGDHKVVCQYVPADLLVIRHLRIGEGGATVSSVEFEKQKEQYSHGLYFRVSFSLQSGGNIETWGMKDDPAYQQRLHRLENEMKNAFLTREENGREHAPLSCEYQRSFGMSPEATFLVAFALPAEDSETVELEYHDTEFGIRSALRFEYKMKDLRAALPEIRFSASNLSTHHDFQKKTPFERHFADPCSDLPV